MVKRFVFKILMFIGLILHVRCGDFLEVSPEDSYSTDLVYRTQEDIIFAVNGLYAFLPFLEADKSDSRLWIYTDDGWRRRGVRGTLLDWSATSSFLGEFYRYEDIRQCNEIIARSTAIDFESEDLEERLVAEARFFRSMLYERMVFLYGGVPLVTSPEDDDFFPERTSRKEVHDFVLSELEEIKNILPESYDDPELGRVTKWAALAMYARACLNAVGWHENVESLYEKAEAACAEIINEGGFELDDGIEGFAKLFTPESDYYGSSPSQGVILSRVYLEDVLTFSEMSKKCLPAGSYQGIAEGEVNLAQYGASWNLVRSFQTNTGSAPENELGINYFEDDPFENRDPRLKASLILPGDVLQSIDGEGVSYYTFNPHPELTTFPSDGIGERTAIGTGFLIRKYSGLGAINDSTIIYDNLDRGHADYKIIRYAEILLMMAECKAAKNDATALSYVNRVRNRVGMPDYNSIEEVPSSLINGTTGNAYLDAVLLERRYEFAGEGYHRMSDIWRYQLGSQVYGAVEGISTDLGKPGALTGERFEAGSRTWDDRNYLFPISEDILNRNPNIKNNPGW